MSALLRELYGPSVFKLSTNNKTLSKPKGDTFDTTWLSSLYHVEINPTNAGIYDKVVVREMIKEIGSTSALLTSGSTRTFRGNGVDEVVRYGGGSTMMYISFVSVPRKVVVIHDADLLTLEAQHALRRTMEKYTSSCRIILIATVYNVHVLPLPHGLRI